ncbi:MAG: TetR/AcrR family transcriptional regulator [Pseudoclavibacter sp.]|nr:TetR/AcrR family transcriptional regulator [Pseudoclavibacter sp.]
MNDVNTRSYHHGNLRAELVRIGVALVAESGEQALALREVARRAGVSASAVYRHFPGREGLRDAVREASRQALGRAVRGELERLAPSAPDTERILAAGRGYFAFATGEPELFGCLADGFALGDGFGGQAFEAAVDGPVPEAPLPEDPFAALVTLVARASGTRQRAGERAIALWAAVHGIAVLCSRGALRELSERRKRELLEATLRTAVHGVHAA